MLSSSSFSTPRPAPDGFNGGGSTPAASVDSTPAAGGFTCGGSAPAAGGFAGFASSKPAASFDSTPAADGFTGFGSAPSAGGFSGFASKPAASFGSTPAAGGFAGGGSAPAAGEFAGFGSTQATSGTQFSFGSFAHNNFTVSSNDRIIKHFLPKSLRKCRHSSMEPTTSASPTQICSTSAQFLSFLTTDQSSTNSCKPNSKSRDENIEQEIAEEHGKTTGEVREANQEPIKNSSLMAISRILKGIPQSPHFYNLRHHSELARKSMISARDWVFEETVEQIHFLKGNDFWVRAGELWKTMEELQTMGYNVIILRRRLVELSDVMEELKLSRLEIKGLKMKAENHRAEKSRLRFMAMTLQEMINEEQESMEKAISQVAEMEKELPNFDLAFIKLAMEPF